MIGSKLLHYEITAKLGEGGMGAVYRATDSKLGREVAIKVLPEAFVEDPERLARFEREARVLAALEHPNIAGIYGLEEVDGQQLLVMQLAPGEDLSARLARGPIPREEALAIALQIAQALEAAHDRGIVHRDLKPANVMLAGDGAVKVLDFGLAKAWDDGPGTDPNLTASPTLTAQMTQAGVILGTAGYMSPEQARGQEADRRADIWSFGVVLHEMVTGERLFQADTVSDTLARVLMAEPEWEAIETSQPAPIAGLLRRCLERDAVRRLQAIGEARITIEDYLADPEAGTGSAAETSTSDEEPGYSSGWMKVAAGIAIGAAIGWLGSFLAGTVDSPPRADPVRFSIHRPMGQLSVASDTPGVAISPDGSQVAFVAAAPDGLDSMIWVKGLEDVRPRPLLETREGYAPFFSPDGQYLGYHVQQELHRVGLVDGSTTQVLDQSGRRGVVWHPDGSLFFLRGASHAIERISISGGESTPVTVLDESREERTHRWLSLLPDGKGLLFTSDTRQTTEYYDDARIEVVHLETGERKVLVEGSSQAMWSPPGHVVYARDGSLYAVPFDLERQEVTGPAKLVQQRVATNVSSGAVEFAISPSGTLVYVPGGKTTDMLDLAWIDVEGGIERAAAQLGLYSQAVLSPTRDRVVLMGADDTGSTQLWVYDMEWETLNRLTFDGGNANPLWTPDGKEVIFGSNRSAGGSRLYRKSADGSGAAELLSTADESLSPLALSPDGELLVVGVMDDASTLMDTRLHLIDLTDEREMVDLFAEPVVGGHVSISPDGRYIAYVVRGRTGTGLELYVRPFPTGEGKWLITSDEAPREPQWTPDGKRLFFRGPSGMQFVDVDLTDGFRVGRPQAFGDAAVLVSPYPMTYSFSPDGKRVLVLIPSVTEQEDWSIDVVLDWQAELERLFEAP